MLPNTTRHAVASPDLSSLHATASRTGEEAGVQQRAIDLIKADAQGIVDSYRKRFGDEFNPDNGAEMFPEYSASPEARRKYRVVVSPAAGWVADLAFQQRIAESDHDPVVFTAGGTGSGKSTIAAGLWRIPTIVFDSTFSNYDLSKQRLQEALDSGRKVAVLCVYRDPMEAYDAAKVRSQNEGQGRMVTVAAHASTHEGSARTIARLAQDFADDPRVAFYFFENSTEDGFWPGTIDLTTRGDYSGLRDRLEEQDRAECATASRDRFP